MILKKTRWIFRILLLGLVACWIPTGCEESTSPNTALIDSATDGGNKSSEREITSDGSSPSDLATDLMQDGSCTPNCTDRVCGPDPVCGTSCGPACATGQCNSQGQCVAIPSSWALKAGGSGDDYGHDIAVDGSGNALITGSFAGQATFGSTTLTSKGFFDIFVAKVTPLGEVLWAISAGGPDKDVSNGIAVDASGNALITGFFISKATFGSTTLYSEGNYDMFLAKISPTGEVLWAINTGGKVPGGTDFENGKSIAVDASGNILVTGTFDKQATFGSTTLFGKGEADMVIIKFSPDGEVLWATSAGGPDFDSGTSIAVDGSGNALVTGDFSGQATFGSTTLSSKGSSDVFVTKVSPSGEILWAISAGGSDSNGFMGWDYGQDIAVDGSGNALVTGKFDSQATFGNTTLTSEESDAFVAKVSPSGEILWAINGGGNGWDYGYGITMDGSGNALVTGEFESQATFGSTTLISKGNSDIFLAKISPAGDVLWATSEGGIGYDHPTCLGLDGNGDALVAGYFSYKTMIGSTILDAASTDIFVAKVPLP